MSEQCHERLEGDAGVDQGGGVGVAELVGGDVSDSGGFGAAVQFLADRGLGEPAAVVGEQELGGASGAGVWQRLAGASGWR